MPCFLIGEDLEHHTCKLPFGGIRTITIDHYYEMHTLDADGHKVVVAKGLDGYLYQLVICKHNPPHTAKRQFTNDNRPPDKLPVYV